MTRLARPILALSVLTAAAAAAGPPYPPSPVIDGITWHRETHVSAAEGSDLWPSTWGPGDSVYLAWGDGGGFGATGRGGRDRVSMGFARLEGRPADWTAINVNGGKDSEHPASWDCDSCGKTAGILAVDGTLYAWLNKQNGEWPAVDMTLTWSLDSGATWSTAGWVFPKGTGNFKPVAFLNFGRDYDGARDGFVYSYGVEEAPWGEGRNVYLARAPRDRLTSRSEHEYLAGLDGSGNPVWSSDVGELAPVFSDPKGVASVQVVHNRGIGRYLLTTSRAEGGELGIFDAPEPWGPWTTVAYYDDWLGAGAGAGLTYGFANKWTSADGRGMWMIFSCYKCAPRYHDRFNMIRATLRLP